jgi:hypothetical protein
MPRDWQRTDKVRKTAHRPCSLISTVLRGPNQPHIQATDSENFMAAVTNEIFHLSWFGLARMYTISTIIAEKKIYKQKMSEFHDGR